MLAGGALMPEVIEMALYFPDGSSCEPFRVSAIEGNEYWAEESTMAMGSSEQVIRYGDVLELDRTAEHAANFRRVVKDSWFVTSTYIIPPALAFTSEFGAMCTRLHAAGGLCEVVFGGLMIIHTPPSTPFHWEEEVKNLPSVPRLDYAAVQELYCDHPESARSCSARAPVRDGE